MQSRREFIKRASLISGALGISSVMPPVIQKAMAINPEKDSTFLDAEHVVFLMQENRSFDHCFGSLKGVRGFNDPRALRLANDVPVWFQSNKKGHTYAPFRLNIKDTKATWMSSLPHTWPDQVDAHNEGKMDGWLDAKVSGNKEYANMPLSMGYYTREDIPFYYALADAFTVCDQNFCSSLTGTSPNRCYFWSGTIRAEDNEDSRAHVWNEDIDHTESLTWKTFPERLQEIGIDWKCYQNELSVGVGFSDEEDPLLANFGDNTLENFRAYNTTVHQAHIQFLERTAQTLTKEISTLKDKRKLKEKQSILDKISVEIAKIKDKKFEQLSKDEKELHHRAFISNVNDPDYHQIVSFDYEEKGEKRSLKIPKGDILHQFRADVDAGKLPTVSWLTAPCVFSDHPSAPWFGAWYLSEVMEILTKNPEVWKKTIFVLTYDENDGYFDHIPPFVHPNPDDENTGKVSKSALSRTEYVSLQQAQGSTPETKIAKRESPIGLGFRVPMIIASPWTRGGYVNSQVFDHTSNLQFLEYFIKNKTRKNIKEENITEWRRAVCGNLTSAFRPYYGEDYLIPKSIDKNEFIENIYNAKFKNAPQNFIKIENPELQIDEKIKKYMPKQEQGTKPACALPHEWYVDAGFDAASQNFEISFKAGKHFFAAQSAGACFKVYASTPYKVGNGTSFEANKNWSFTVAAGEGLKHRWNPKDFETELYHLSVYGANGFYRLFKGSNQDPKIRISVGYETRALGQITGNIVLRVENVGLEHDIVLQLNDHSYGAKSSEIVMKEKQDLLEIILDTEAGKNWYDFSVRSTVNPDFEHRFAGRVENGKESVSDPLMA